jgi:hypothetical protein
LVDTSAFVDYRSNIISLKSWPICERELNHVRGVRAMARSAVRQSVFVTNWAESNATAKARSREGRREEGIRQSTRINANLN